MEINKSRLFNFIFVGVLVLVLLLGAVRTLAFPKDINVYENRTAEKVIGFESENFASGEFQDSMENAFADQVPLAERSKMAYNTVLSGFKKLAMRLVGRGFGTDFKTQVIKLTDEINMYGDHLYYSKGRDMWDDPKLDDGLAKINAAALAHPELRFFVYYVEREIENDFESGEKAGLAEYMKDHLVLTQTDGSDSVTDGPDSVTGTAGGADTDMDSPADGSDSHFGVFEVSDFKTFDDYFYKTDHHWNYKGSYKGYTEVAKMMGLVDSESSAAGADSNRSLLKPLGIYNVGWLSGSRAAGVGEASYKEIHQVYEFDFPQMKVTINGLTSGVAGNTDGDYGSQADYIAKAKANWWGAANGGVGTQAGAANGQTLGDMNLIDESSNFPVTDDMQVSYGLFYGNDNAETIFENPTGNGRRLLIFGDSYDNAVLKLLASHYSYVYSIDARWYKSYTGYLFNFDEYVKTNSIDDVLFLGSNTFFEYPF